MAASSPAPSNNSNETATANGGTPPRRPAPFDAPRTSLRGLNKPRCSTCGNVARSKCPFHSCKSCCSTAQNPCPIHVLKSNANLPDRPVPSSTPLLDQPSTDAPPSGSSLRPPSHRQLSNKYAQYNGAQVRARRPLTLKDAAAINSWRFSKLKEYNDQNIEAESEAFDRYMQNVSLLEESFLVNTSLEGFAQDVLPAQLSATLSAEDETEKLILVMKAKLKSNVERADKYRERIRELIDRGFKRLRKWEFDDEGGSTNLDDFNGERELKRPKKVENFQVERMTAINDLLDKLNKAGSKEELKSCLEMKVKLFNHKEVADPLASGKSDFHPSKDGQISEEQNDKDASCQISEEQNDKDASLSRHEFDMEISSSPYSLPKLWRTAEINQEMLSGIDMQFSSLNQIANL